MLNAFFSKFKKFFRYLVVGLVTCLFTTFAQEAIEMAGSVQLSHDQPVAEEAQPFNEPANHRSVPLNQPLGMNADRIVSGQTLSFQTPISGGTRPSNVMSHFNEFTAAVSQDSIRQQILTQRAFEQSVTGVPYPVRSFYQYQMPSVNENSSPSEWMQYSLSDAHNSFAGVYGPVSSQIIYTQAPAYVMPFIAY